MAPRKEHKLRIRRLSEGHRPKVTGKELILIIVTIIAIGLAGYATYDSNNAFGLLQTAPEDSKTEPPLPNVQTDFEEEAFTAQTYTNRVHSTVLPSQESTGAAVYDPTEPPAVVTFNGYRMKTGNGIVVYWEKPEFVQAVNIYKKRIGSATSGVGEELVTFAEGRMYVDEAVEEGEAYQYTIESVNDIDGQLYYSDLVKTVSVQARDVIRPQDPTNVVVTSSFADSSQVDHGALRVEWENPPDEDVERIEVYRSENFGERGQLIAAYSKDGESYEFAKYNTLGEIVASAAVGEEETTRYTDNDVKPNVSYYYVVIAIDEVGNVSSGNFQVPAPGNANPFAPIDLEQYQTEESTPFQ